MSEIGAKFKVKPGDLKAIDTPADGEVPAYNALQGLFEWVAAPGMQVHDKTYHTSPALPDDDAHKTASPIDHPDAAITTAKIAADQITAALLAHNIDATGIGFDADKVDGKHAAELGYFKQVAKVDVAETTSQITVTGLDLNADIFWILIFKVTNPTAWPTNYRLFMNAEMGIGWYYAQVAVVNNAAFFGVRVNSPDLLYADAGERAHCMALFLRDPDGYPRICSYASYYTGDTLADYFGAVCKKVTVTNVTRIDIVSEVNSAIGAGSQLIILGVR